MTRKPSAQGNLVKANELKKLGFKSLLDAQPAMKDRFTVLWHEGKSLNAARKILLEEFKDGHVPSLPSLSAFVKNHLKGQTIDTRAPDYAVKVRQFDSIGKLYYIAEEAVKTYNIAKTANARLDTRRRLLDTARAAVLDVADKEIKLGLREAVYTPENLHLHNHPNSGGNGDPAKPTQYIELEAGIDLIEDVETVKKLIDEARKAPIPTQKEDEKFYRDDKAAATAADTASVDEADQQDQA